MCSDKSSQLSSTVEALPLDIPCLEEIEDQGAQEGSTSVKTVTTISSTDSETRTVSPGPPLAPLQKNIKRNIGIASDTGKTITSSSHLEPISPSSRRLITSDPLERGDGQQTIPSFSPATAEHPTTKDVGVRDSQDTSEFVVSLTETQARVSSIIEEQFSYDDGIEVSTSKPSPIVSHSPSVPMDVLQFEGNPSHIEEDLSFATLVTRENEQLVSNKYLASENLSLLTDFLVKHPSVRLVDNARRHSSKYKGFAYNCLAELLKFLQTHSALDVLGSSHSNFVALLEDVRCFPFDKDWLDAVERRALFPGLQVSQDALQKLLDSKRILTQHVEDLKHQLASSEAVLENIIQQEAQVLEARAALSAPLGY